MLTDKGLKALRPKAKPYKKSDGKGLFVIVRKDGAIWWRFKYRYGGVEKGISLGVYPDTSLKLAREKRDDARQQLAAGIDPSVARKETKQQQADTFKGVALEWLDLEKEVSQSTTDQLRRRLKKYAFPKIGSRPIRTVTAPDVLAMLRGIEAAGLIETAHRVKMVCGQVFRYAVASGRADRDPTADLKGALATAKTRHFAALTDKREVGGLLRAIDSYTGGPSATAGIRLLPYVFVRPSELRNAEWSEFDLEEGRWLIPAERMKMDRDHIVPLSSQSVAILKELHEHTGDGQLVFPSIRSRTRPLSENTLNACLRSIGYTTEQQTAHGFRTTASTLLHDLGWNTQLVEIQLAHADRNKVRASYNRAERLPERVKMMQAYADFLDTLKNADKSNVVAIRA